jgi:hypothetical protein
MIRNIDESKQKPEREESSTTMHHGLRVKFELETPLSCILVPLLIMIVSCILTIHMRLPT